MKRIIIVLAAILFLSLNYAPLAVAQTNQLVLKLSRDNGYGGLNNEIEGLFSMRVTGPADLSSVDYFIDDMKIGQVLQAPFNYQFITDDYPFGIHQLSATGNTANGVEYHSNVITVNFVPKQSALKVILPVLGVIFLALILSALGAFVGGGRKQAHAPLGAERSYGAGGGGVCTNCHRPFAVSLFSPHLGFSRLARCPYCGKWNLVKITTLARLREAERAELDGIEQEQVRESSDDDGQKREMDDSKYQDL